MILLNAHPHFWRSTASPVSFLELHRERRQADSLPGLPPSANELQIKSLCGTWELPARKTSIGERPMSISCVLLLSDPRSSAEHRSGREGSPVSPAPPAHVSRETSWAAGRPAGRPARAGSDGGVSRETSSPAGRGLSPTRDAELRCVGDEGFSLAPRAR